MGLFSPSFAREGKGVSKERVAEKRGLFTFFETVFPHTGKICLVSLLFVICCLPVFTIGPATAGLTYVCRCISRERQTFVVSDFFEYFKKGFGKSVAVGLINLFIIIVLSVDVYYFLFLTQHGFVRTAALCLSALLLIIFNCLTYYVNFMLVSFELSLGAMYKNAYKFLVLGLKSNLAIIISLAFVYLLLFSIAFALSGFGIILSSLILLIFIPGFQSCVIQFCVFSPLRKYMIDPYYNAHPNEDVELRYSLGLLSEKEAFGKQETVFADLIKKDENECLNI